MFGDIALNILIKWIKPQLLQGIEPWSLDLKSKHFNHYTTSNASDGRTGRERQLVASPGIAHGILIVLYKRVLGQGF